MFRIVNVKNELIFVIFDTIMKAFYKYLPVPEQDLKFGLILNNCGYAHIPPQAEYPDPKHPTHHYFEYKKGRVLNEYQVLYITEGSGVFESKSIGQIPLKEGSIMILFPGEWHRYKPNSQTGWTEYWIGFTGSFAEHLYKNDFISKETPVIYIGHNDEVFDLYHKIFQFFKEENIGFQHHISGIVIHLIGLIASLKARSAIKSTHIEKIITKSKLLLIESSDSQISPEDIAKELNISYSWFRRIFKTYTSFSPKEYIIELRISNAKQLLISTHKPIKEIAIETGFNSQYHFCKVFKKKTLFSPSEFRLRNTLSVENMEVI